MNTHLDAPVPDRMLDAVKLVRNISWGQRPTAVSVARERERERERVEAVGNTGWLVQGRWPQRPSPAA